MTNDCKTCPVSTGTHKPAEAVHQIDEPQSEALRLAAWLLHRGMSGIKQNDIEASNQLRWLHAESLQHKQELAAYRFTVANREARIAELESQLEAIGAGGVEPLRKCNKLHQIAEPAEQSATYGMHFGDRVLHIGGRENAAGYIEFGSVEAVRVLVGQVLRDLPGGAPGFELAATHPTQQELADDGMYYLQDARWSAMVGNCPSFWREGGGYTTNLDEAERFTLEAAMKQHKCRETDLPWLCTEVDKLRRPTVDCQFMPRSWDAQRSALAAQAEQGEQANG